METNTFLSFVFDLIIIFWELEDGSGVISSLLLVGIIVLWENLELIYSDVADMEWRFGEVLNQGTVTPEPSPSET